MPTATREMRFLLADPERRLLRAIAGRVPLYLRPNHFTVLGTIGAVGAGAAYALTVRSAAWLWVASLMLALNWLGDSLDGTIARVRQIERPRYGYYLDHIVDAFSTAVIGIGLGMSPYVDLGVALALVLVYLVLSINVYLEHTVFGVFKLAYGRVGPTEARILLILANAALALGLRRPEQLPSSVQMIGNGVVITVLLAMVGMFVARFIRNLTSLAKLEPQETRRRSPHSGATPAPPIPPHVAVPPPEARVP